MAELMNTTKDQLLARNLTVAESFLQRGIGLLGKKSIHREDALWIKNCFDVHTFFMRFAIDVVFLDEQMKVRDIRRNLKPWRMAFSPGSKSVIEFLAGTITDNNLDVGDQLNVGN